MKIETLTLGCVSTNCHIVSNNGKCLVIDPADHAHRIIDHLQRNSLECQGVLLTHGHFDHIAATDDLVNALGIKYYVHKDDAEMMRNTVYNASCYFGDHVTVETKPEIFYAGGIYNIGGFTVTVIETPGHSKGSVCYLIDNNLFCGDLLFSDSCGRVDLHGSSVKDIVSSIAKIITTLPDETMIYSGHGDDFTLFNAKNTNYVVSNIINGNIR